MKVAVLGAAGKLGRRLVESCLARGHDVTAITRRAGQVGQRERLRVATLDVTKASALDAALAGQDALISAAGNVVEGERFVALFNAIVASAERVLGDRRRVWMLAGGGILDVPDTGRIGLDLPFFPARYRPHRENWRRLERSSLDWALMCPGPMVDEDTRPGGALMVCADTLPYGVGAWALFAPSIALSLMFKQRVGRITVPYSRVADIIANNLEPGGEFRRKRVGVGWRDPAP